jgi:4-alpha-glucanotransferase
VAGVPPDAFSATGQLWGNPIYRWSYHEETDYAWWMKRIAHAFRIYDVVRIDHFRGFESFWVIPEGSTDATAGEWRKGPGDKLFETMRETIGEEMIIAEDLGMLTVAVHEMLSRTGYPGMKVLQFAFDEDATQEYLPHNYTNNYVVYTGTHDNDTSRGWFEKLEPRKQRFVLRYTGAENGHGVVWALIRAAMMSVADTAIIPMQDYLNLGSLARINTPSTIGDNWKWRLMPGELSQALAESMHELAEVYGRL